MITLDFLTENDLLHGLNKLDKSQLDNHFLMELLNKKNDVLNISHIKLFIAHGVEIKLPHLEAAYRHRNIQLMRFLMEKLKIKESLQIQILKLIDNSNTLALESPLSVRDTEGKWLKAIILQRRESEVYIQYEGWDEKWNEWINLKKNPDRFKNLSESNHSCILDAIKTNNSSLANELIQLYTDVDNKEGNSLSFQTLTQSIYLAIKEGRDRIVSLFINSDILTQKSLENIENHPLATAIKNGELSAVINFIEHSAFAVRKEEKMKHVNALFDYAIQHRKPHIAKFLIIHHAKVEMSHLNTAFKSQSPECIDMLLIEDKAMQADELLLSAARQNQNDLVEAYLNRRNLPSDTHDALCDIIVSNENLLALKLEIHKKPNNSLLSPNTDKQWRFTKNYFSNLPPDKFDFSVAEQLLHRYILQFGCSLNSMPSVGFHEHRQFALDFGKDIIKKMTNPHDIIKLVRTLFEIEKKSSLLIKRTGKYSMIKGCQWDGHGVSIHWTNYVAAAKKRTFDLIRLNPKFALDDGGIKEFFGSPTGFWTNCFFKTTTEKTYKKYKEEAARKIHLNIHTISSFGI